MKMVLIRHASANGWTLGELSIDGAHECFTCEDAIRTGAKVPGETAIPPGTYRVLITESPRFKRRLPILLDVPGFSGVRIHTGNTRYDTEGCILPGRSHQMGGVTQSVGAFEALFARIDAALLVGEDVTLEIRNPAPADA
jgi:hypothetical protein